VQWHHLEREGLNLSWAKLFPKESCRELFKRLEEEIVYFTGDLGHRQGLWESSQRAKETVR
jgi:hypothetical protein